MLLQYIPIKEINTADDSFRITFTPDVEKLRCSIKSIGVVDPVQLRHTSDGSYQIISGYKRVLACEKLNRQTIPALIHEHTSLSPLQAFLLNLHGNVFCRELNLIEKAMAFGKLYNSYGINEDDLTNTYLPLTGEPKSYKVLHQFLTINNIIEPMKEHIIKAHVAVSCAARISEFSPSTQQALLNVLKPIRPNTNKLNELLTLIREISARDGLSVEDVLHRYELLTIVANPEVAAPEKITALRQTLKGVKLPQLTAKQAEFSRLIEQMHLPTSAKLKADPYFENPNMKLEYEFEEPEELGALVTKLQEALEGQTWQKIFEWYRS